MHNIEPRDDEPCPGIEVTGLPPEWDITEMMLEHAIQCPVPTCRRWVRRWRLGSGRMSHGDPGE